MLMVVQRIQRFFFLQGKKILQKFDSRIFELLGIAMLTGAMQARVG